MPPIVPGPRQRGHPHFRAATLAASSAQLQAGAWVTYLLVAAVLACTTVALINAIVARRVRAPPSAAAGRAWPGPAAARSPAGPWIYLTVTSAAVLLTVGVTWLATRLVNTDPGPRNNAAIL